MGGNNSKNELGRQDTVRVMNVQAGDKTIFDFTVPGPLDEPVDLKSYQRSEVRAYLIVNTARK
jgi:hypothetical protein